MQYAIIIVTRNSSCLIDLMWDIDLFCNYTNVSRVVIVDNGSNEDFHNTLTYVEKSFALPIDVIKLSKNNLYTRANNIGISYLEENEIPYDYVFIINPDIRMYMTNLGNRDPLEQIVNEMIIHEAGIAGAKLQYDEHIIEHAGGRENSHVGYREDASEYIDVIEVEWVTGALWCVSRETFKKLGYLDGTLYTHWVSDQEYCRRAAHHGIKTICCNNIAFIHHQGQSTDGRPHDKVYEDLPENLIPNVIPFPLEHIKQTARSNSQDVPLVTPIKWRHNIESI